MNVPTNCHLLTTNYVQALNYAWSLHYFYTYYSNIFLNEKTNVSWQRHMNDSSGIANIFDYRIECNTSLHIPRASPPLGSQKMLAADAPCLCLELLDHCDSNESTMPNTSEMHRPQDGELTFGK